MSSAPVPKAPRGVELDWAVLEAPRPPSPLTMLQANLAAPPVPLLHDMGGLGAFGKTASSFATPASFSQPLSHGSTGSINAVKLPGLPFPPFQGGLPSSIFRGDGQAEASFQRYDSSPSIPMVEEEDDGPSSSLLGKRPFPIKAMQDHMRAYWQSKGITVKAQLDKLLALSNTRQLYADPQRLDEKLIELRRLLPDTDIIKLIGNSPSLLIYKVSVSIAPKVAALRKLGIDGRIIAATPALLTFDIDKTVAPKVANLRKLLPRADVMKILRAAPNLLSYESSTLRPKLEQLRELMPSVDIDRLISYAPTLLYHDTNTSIGPKLRDLAVLLPGCDIVKICEAAPPLLCSDIQGSVARKLGWMRRMVAGKPEEVNEKIESNPRLLTCGYGVVFGRLEFVSRKHYTNGQVPVKELRAILLSPVTKFSKDHPTYVRFLAEEVIKHTPEQRKGVRVEEVALRGSRKLENDYGLCLRKIVKGA